MSNKENKKLTTKWYVAIILIAFIILIAASYFILDNHIVGKVGAKLEETLDSENESVSENIDYDAEYTWLQENESLYPENKVEQAVGNKELIHFLYRLGNGDYVNNQEIVMTDEELSGGIPLLMQWDDRWGFDTYGSNVIGITGCGPTCLSMVILGLTGDTSATPRGIANWSEREGFYITGEGTNWNLLRNMLIQYGLYVYQYSADEQLLKDSLDAGRVAILSMGQGHFTDIGHFIVVKASEDGKLVVNDPNSIENSNTLWNYEDIASEIKSMWIIDTEDFGNNG